MQIQTDTNTIVPENTPYTQLPSSVKINELTKERKIGTIACDLDCPKNEKIV